MRKMWNRIQCVVATVFLAAPVALVICVWELVLAVGEAIANWWRIDVGELIFSTARMALGMFVSGAAPKWPWKRRRFDESGPY